MVRFLLNYKGLLYKTEHVRFESIESNNKVLGLGPSSTSSPYWTLPAIRDAPVGKAPVAIADSVKIADYLEEMYPERPLATKALRDASAPHIQALVQHVFEHMWRIIVPAAVKNFDGPTLAFYNSTRGAIFGAPRTLAVYAG
jgi:glutathione S-transferase